MFELPDTKTMLLVLALLSAVVIGAMFGHPYYQEGMKNKNKNKDKPVAATSKTVFEKSLGVDNDGEDLDEPMPFADKNPLKACKDACIELADCIGFTVDQEQKQCVFKSTRGEDSEDSNMSSFWKK